MRLYSPKINDLIANPVQYYSKCLSFKKQFSQMNRSLKSIPFSSRFAQRMQRLPLLVFFLFAHSNNKSHVTHLGMTTSCITVLSFCWILLMWLGSIVFSRFCIHRTLSKAPFRMNSFIVSLKTAIKSRNSTVLKPQKQPNLPLALVSGSLHQLNR